MITSPAERGRLGGLKNRGQDRRHTVRLFDLLREMFARDPQPTYAEVVDQVQKTCPWSLLNYKTYLTYKGRFQRGIL